MRERPARVSQEIREEIQKPSQVKCFRCHRRDHSGQQRPKLLTCDYCQGRFHTTVNCKERLAVGRQQELLNTVRIATQETLAVIRGVAGQLSPHGNFPPMGVHAPAEELYASRYPQPHRISFPPIYAPHSYTDAFYSLPNFLHRFLVEQNPVFPWV